MAVTMTEADTGAEEDRGVVKGRGRDLRQKAETEAGADREEWEG